MKQVVPKDAVFSPDGTRLATWSGFRNAQLWNALTAQPLGLPLQHSEPISAVSFSSDGSRVATASRDWTARVWDVRTGQPISPPLQHFGPALDASFSPDGARLLTMSGDGSARLWHLPVTTTEDAPLIVELAEIVSGYHVSEAGSLIAVMDASVRLQGFAKPRQRQAGNKAARRPCFVGYLKTLGSDGSPIARCLQRTTTFAAVLACACRRRRVRRRGISQATRCCERLTQIAWLGPHEILRLPAETVRSDRDQQLSPRPGFWNSARARTGSSCARWPR